MSRRPDAYVYVLSAGPGPKKIGASAWPNFRASRLEHLFANKTPRVAWKAWQPYDAYAVESFTFTLLRSKALGREMFDVTVKEAAAAIREAAAAIRANDFSAYPYDFVPRCARVAGARWMQGLAG